MGNCTCRSGYDPEDESYEVTSKTSDSGKHHNGVDIPDPTHQNGKNGSDTVLVTDIIVDGDGDLGIARPRLDSFAESEYFDCEDFMDAEDGESASAQEKHFTPRSSFEGACEPSSTSGGSGNKQPGIPRRTISISNMSFTQQNYEVVQLQWLNKLYGTNAKDYTELPAFYDFRNLGGADALPQSQLDMIDKLRAEFPQSKHFHTNADLWRFCTARDFVWKDVRATYSNYVEKFRTGREVSSATPFVRPAIGAEWENVPWGNLLPRSQEDTRKLLKIYDCFMENVVFRSDKCGRPVVWLKPGTPIVKGLATSGAVPVEDRMIWHTHAFEQLNVLCHVASQRAGKYVGKVTCIMDLSGSDYWKTLRHIQRKDTSKESWFLGEYFPERFYKIFVINAPSGAGTLWELIKPILPKSTQQKIVLCSSKYMKQLLEHIDVENIPSVYGGEADFAFPPLQNYKTYQQRDI